MLVRLLVYFSRDVGDSLISMLKSTKGNFSLSEKTPKMREENKDGKVLLLLREKVRVVVDK